MASLILFFFCGYLCIACIIATAADFKRGNFFAGISGIIITAVICFIAWTAINGIANLFGGAA